MCMHMYTNRYHCFNLTFTIDRSPSPCHTFCSTLYIAGRLEPRIPAGSRASSKMETPRPPPPSRLVNLIRLLFSTVAPRHPKTHPFVLVSGEKDVWADVRPVIMVHARDRSRRFRHSRDAKETIKSCKVAGHGKLTRKRFL